MFTSNIFMHSLEQIFSDALQSSSFHTQMHSYKLKSTFSYGLHKHSLTYEQAYTNEQLHTVHENVLTHAFPQTCSQIHSQKISYMLPVTYLYISTDTT